MFCYSAFTGLRRSFLFNVNRKVRHNPVNALDILNSKITSGSLSNFCIELQAADE